VPELIPVPTVPVAEALVPFPPGIGNGASDAVEAADISTVMADCVTVTVTVPADPAHASDGEDTPLATSDERNGTSEADGAALTWVVDVTWMVMTDVAGIISVLRVVDPA